MQKENRKKNETAKAAGRLETDFCIRITDNGQGPFPMGAQVTEMGVHFCIAAPGEKAPVLLIYRNNCTEDCLVIPFPEKNRLGNIWYITVAGFDKEKDTYGFRTADGMALEDIYAKKVTEKKVWGDPSWVMEPIRYSLPVDSFDWEEDSNPAILREDMVMYRIHTRGFTKHATSGVRKKGMFEGIVEKIPYMKRLGITTVELMMPDEYEETKRPGLRKADRYQSVHKDDPEQIKAGVTVEPELVKINYWGYAKAYHFAVKQAFGGGTELKKLVKALHQAGMELVVELFFEAGLKTSFVLDCLRYWVEEFHIDGIRLSGNVPIYAIAEEDALSRVKLFAPSWDGVYNRAAKHLFTYHDGFMVDVRKFIKGDEELLSSILYHLKNNPDDHGVVNYVANSNGFTLMDMVSYDRKHNEANGERNTDGTDYNHSWNCGVEGPSRKKKVVELRKKQLRNALVILFLSQGVPLLLSGDEMGHSKGGNNNSYCQDNPVSWLNWKINTRNKDIYTFVQYMIQFRKKHGVFHMARQPQMSDYLSYGFPDVSVHGVSPWFPQFETYRRQLALLYYGRYSKSGKDQSFYVMFNMHWEVHTFSLPKTPDKTLWHLAVHTAHEEVNGIYREGEEPVLASQTSYELEPRSIAVLIGKKAEKDNEQKENRS